MADRYTIPNLTTGIDDAIIDTVSAVPSFIPMFLVFVWCVVWLGGVTAQRRRSRTADYPMWTTMASLSTLIIALPLTLTTGLISLTYLSIVGVLTIFSGVWLFRDRNRNEI